MKQAMPSSMPDIRSILRYAIGIAKSWYIILLLTLTLGIVSYLYIHKEEDMYQSSMQVLLKSDDVYNYQSALYKGLGATQNPYATYEHIASEMRVIKSSSILNKVLDKLKLDVSYFITGRIKTSEVFEHLPFRVDSRNFEGNRVRHFSLNIKDLDAYILGYSLGEERKQIEARFGDWIVKDGIFITIEKNSNLNELSLETLKKIDYSFVINDRNHLLARYKGNLELENVEFTSVVQITLQDNIPERAKFFLDTLGQVYIDYSKQNKIDVNTNTLMFINKQIEEVTDIINEIGGEIEGYKAAKNILNLTKEEELFFSQLTEREQELKLTELAIHTVDDLVDYVSNLEEDDVSLPPSTIMLQDDPTLKLLIDDLYSLHLKRLNVLDEVSTENPRYLDLVQQIDQARSEIVEYLKKTRQFLIREQGMIEKDIAEITSKIKYIPKDTRELMNIEKRLEVNEQLYSFLLSRRAETIIARAGILPETKIIEAPRVAGVVYPDRQKFVLQWTAIGLVVGLVLAFLKVYFFDKIETLDELSEHTDMPIIGMIPPIQNDVKYLFNDTNTRSRLYDAFRNIRVNLELLGAQNNRKVIVISSLLPGEGKTFTSVNTAYILSRTQKKVLLIDCDLHKPRVMKAFDQKVNVGLSNYLAGSVSLVDIVHHHDEYFDVIFAGVIPPSASELVASERMDALVKLLRGSYDYIIIDSPPIALITDALVLMAIADHSVFVLNSKFTTKRTLSSLEEIIVKRSKATNYSLILNNAKRPATIRYYGSYSYYYGYGYGQQYGDNITDEKGV